MILGKNRPIFTTRIAEEDQPMREENYIYTSVHMYQKVYKRDYMCLSPLCVGLLNPLKKTFQFLESSYFFPSINILIVFTADEWKSTES